MEDASNMTKHIVVTGDSKQMDLVPDESVHLQVYPEVRQSFIDTTLIDAMQKIGSLVSA